MTDDSSSAADRADRQPRFWPTTQAHNWHTRFQRFLLDHPQTRQFAGFLGGEEALGLGRKEMHDLHHRAIGYLHGTLNGPARRSFVSAIDVFAQSLGVPALTLDAAPAAAVEAIDSDGFVSLPPVEDAVVDLIREALEQCQLTSWNGEYSGLSEELRGRANLGTVSQQDVLAVDAVWRLGLDPAVLAVARRHLGAPPILLDIAAWKSFAAPGHARDAQLFHYDMDDYRFCKLFIYLTDVSETGGPHVYVPETHRPEVVSAARPPEGMTERAAFEEWYFRTLRKSDDDTRRRFGRDPVRMTGKKGARFLVNTEGLHKGEPPIDCDRWILQFEYGVSAFTQWGGAFDVPVVEPQDAELEYAAQLLFAGPNRFRAL